MVGTLEAKFIGCSRRDRDGKVYYNISLVQDGDPFRFNLSENGFNKAIKKSFGDDVICFLSIRQFNNSIYCSISDIVE